MNLRIKFIQRFTDGTIFDREMKQGEEREVSEVVYQRVLSSGGEVEVVGRVVPPTTVKGATTTASKRGRDGKFVKVVLPDPDEVKGDVLVFDEDEDKTITPDKVDD